MTLLKPASCSLNHRKHQEAVFTYETQSWNKHLEDKRLGQLHYFFITFNSVWSIWTITHPCTLFFFSVQSSLLFLFFLFKFIFRKSYLLINIFFTKCLVKMSSPFEKLRDWAIEVLIFHRNLSFARQNTVGTLLIKSDI